MTTIKINGIQFSHDVVGTLEHAGRESAECVAADLATVRAGGHDTLLAECLDGVDGPDVASAWREYVETLAVHVAAEAERVSAAFVALDMPAE